MINFKQIDNKNFVQYTELLRIIGQLSKLFSSNNVPFINYRVVENLFCKCFDADNLSRSDTAFDAKYNETGIGIKTFILNNITSYEKIAEFNNLSNKINKLEGKDLALLVSSFRNDRISLARRLYKITDSQYHIIARKESQLLLFDTDYDIVNIERITGIKQSKSTVTFNDSNNEYRYSYSKSTLYRKFVLPKEFNAIDINIIDDPYSLLLSLQDRVITDKNSITKQSQFIILPLYGRNRIVHPKSGLNQWNAEGRTRDPGELYIPIPIIIHKYFPNFFPEKDKPFRLRIPTGEVFSAKVCQEKGKALMTNPNKQLSEWLLRTVLQLKEGELATIEKLDKLGFDSVIIIKSEINNEYLIDIRKTGTYESFINQNQDNTSL